MIEKIDNDTSNDPFNQNQSESFSPDRSIIPPPPSNQKFLEIHESGGSPKEKKLGAKNEGERHGDEKENEESRAGQESILDQSSIQSGDKTQRENEILKEL